MHLNLKSKTLTVYQAFKGFERQLIDEIGFPHEQIGELMLYSNEPKETLWAKNIWKDSQTIDIESISDASRKLRALGKLWIPYYHSHIRRAKLIQEKLAAVPIKRLNFLEVIPNTPLGHWTLLNEHTILASPNCSSIRPEGNWEFHEDKLNPPSRAYLKLWELFTRLHFYPNNEYAGHDLYAQTQISVIAKDDNES